MHFLLLFHVYDDTASPHVVIEPQHMYQGGLNIAVGIPVCIFLTRMYIFDFRKTSVKPLQKFYLNEFFCDNEV